MPRQPRRVINPVDDVAARRMGHRTARELDLDQQQGARFLDDQLRRRIVIPTDTISFFRENIGGAGDADYTMRQATPTASATWGSVTIDAYMGAAGRVIGGRLWTNAARTAGTATLQVQITEGAVVTNHLLPDCVLDATNPQTIAVVIPFGNGIRFAKGATLRAEVQTAGTFTPNTADAAAEILVAYEGVG